MSLKSFYHEVPIIKIKQRTGNIVRAKVGHCFIQKDKKYYRVKFERCSDEFLFSDERTFRV